MKCAYNFTIRRELNDANIYDIIQMALSIHICMIDIQQMYD